MPTAKQLKKKSQKKRAKEAKKTLALTQIASPIVVECEAPAAAAEITDQEPRGLSACDQSLDTTTLQSVPEIISAAVIEPVKVPATAQNVCDGLCDDVNSEKISEKKPEKRSQRKRAQAAKQKAASISVSADEIKVDASEPIPIATPIDPSTDSEPAATFFSACINSVAALVDLNSKSVETVAIPVAKKSAEVPEVPLVVQTAVENLPTEQKFNETQIERAIEPISSNLDIPAPDIVENAPAAAAIVEKNDPSPECVAKNDENDDSMQPIETVDSAIDLDLDEKLGFTTPVSPVKLVETKYYDSFEEIRKTILNTDGEQQKKIKKNLKKKKAKQAAAKLTPSTETKFECKKEAVIVAEVEIVADQPEEEYATSAPQEEIDVYIPTPYVAPVVYKTNHPYLFEVEVFRSHHPDMGYYISKMLEDTSLSLANIYTDIDATDIYFTREVSEKIVNCDLGDIKAKPMFSEFDRMILHPFSVQQIWSTITDRRDINQFIFMAQPQAACKMLSQLHAIDSTLKVLIDFRKQLRPIDISMISMIPNVGGKAREKEVAYLESTTDWLIVSLDCRFKDGRQIFEMCKESSNSSIFFARNQEQSRRQFCCFFPERMNGCLPN